MTRRQRPDHRQGKAASDAIAAARGGGRPSAWWVIAGFVALGVIVVIAHAPVLSAQALCFDDREFLADNPLVQNPSWAAVGRFLGEVFEPSTVSGYYIPLTMISLMLDHALGGRPDELHMFHLTNLTLHVLATAAVALLLYLLFQQPVVALLFGLLYGVHPLIVEPIAWIGERKTVLASVLALWCLVFYVLHTRRRNRALYGTSLLLFVLSLMAKPTTVPLPVLLLLLDYWPLGRFGRRALVEKVPFFVLAAVSAFITIVSNARTQEISFMGHDTPVPVPLKICHNIIFYLSKIVWPTRLTSYYPPPEPFALSHPMVLAGVVGTGLLLGILIISLRWTRVWIIGFGFFLVAILPTLGIVGFSWILASDKYLYFPVLGLLLPLAWCVTRFWNRSALMPSSAVRRGGIIGLAVILALWEILGTRGYLAHWRDSESLYRHMLSIAPKAPVVHCSLANVLSDAGRTDEAVNHYLAALKDHPGYADAHVGLGRALFARGDGAGAVEHLNTALHIDPASVTAHSNLGSVLDALGQSEEAIHHLKEALRINPGYATAHHNLGVAYMRLGRVDEAIEQYRAALRIHPTFLEVHANLAVALQMQGKLAEAVRHYRAAIRLSPHHPQIHQRLATALQQQGNTAEANFHFAEARYGQGLAFEDQGRLDAAVNEYQQALRINPQHAAAAAHLNACRARSSVP